MKETNLFRRFQKQTLSISLILHVTAKHENITRRNKMGFFLLSVLSKIYSDPSFIAGVTF